MSRARRVPATERSDDECNSTRFGRNWSRKIRPHLGDKEAQRLLVRDFNKFTAGRWGQRLLPGMTPHEFESCDWWCDHPGRMPEYWNYVKHSACHWLVNFNRRLATLAEPKRQWRIVSFDEHSTVWDGAETLFDMNFLAPGVEPNEAWRLASLGRVYPVGKNLVCHFAENCRTAA